MGVLEQAYKTAMEKPLRVLDIFNEFFGEDRVDMQGFPTLAEVESVLSETASANTIKEFIIRSTQATDGAFILVHFPHVRVTNEFDRHVDITHLYAKVTIDIDGKLMRRFELNRSEYTLLQFTNDYMHSHVSAIPTYNFQDFQAPCTGTGPINSTICSLAREFDEDLWRLFCLELDKFTQVESVTGTPYHRLESLVNGGRGSSYVVNNMLRLRGSIPAAQLCIRNSSREYILRPAQLVEFIKYVIDSNILKFTYQNGGYYLAMAPAKYYIAVSNAFIEWYNKKYRKGEVTTPFNELVNTHLLSKLKYIGGQLISESGGRMDYTAYIGSKICTFKGHDVLLSITDIPTDSEEDHYVYILNQDVAEYVFTKILNVLNFRYGSNREEGDGTSKKVIYL